MPSGRRSQFLFAFGVAAFLFVAIQISPVFFLGPLVVLLLLSRPATPREWLWIVVCAAALVAWFRPDNSISERTVRAAAIFFVGGFTALTLAGMRSLFSRAALAVVFAALATTGWFLALHLRFEDVQTDIVNQAWSSWRQLSTGLPSTPPTDSTTITTGDSATDFSGQMAAAVVASAKLFPACIALAALVGSWLASIAYFRVTRHPIGMPSAPLREFRFNDHLVWVLVIGVALAVVHTTPAVALATMNLLAVILAAYALRGLAVIRAMPFRLTPLFIGVLIVIMLPLLPFFLVGIALIGVADTWLDFRRRLPPLTGVPS